MCEASLVGRAIVDLPGHAVTNEASFGQRSIAVGHFGRQWDLRLLRIVDLCQPAGH